GNKIPAGATDGSVDWIRLANVAVSGRLMVINRQAGMTSSYDCVDCCCAGQASSMSLAPPAFYVLPLDVQQISSTAGFLDCNNELTYYDETLGSSWSSDDSSVCSIGGQGVIDANAGGLCTITAQFISPKWVWDAGLCAHVFPPIALLALSHGAVCSLSIVSPSSNQVISLGGGNYNQAPVSLKTDGACTGSVSWTLNFTYTSRQPATYKTTSTSSGTTNNTTNYTTPVGAGGQVTAQAQATLAGHNFQSSVTFYVLGTAIPNATITSRLESLYTGATYGLLTGIAMHESNYGQFYSYAEMGLLGKWPHGNAALGGVAPDTYVGLMQVPNGMAPGFDWYTNTLTGKNTFQQKLSTAGTCETTEQGTYKGLPSLSGSQLEENALVFYAGDSGTGTCSQVSPNLYWIPNGTGTAWVVNTSSPGYNYVNNVEGDIQ
ncbi:MAG: hypothetical protein ACRD2O_04300, partial [Terriglobia bacterium]